jgi:transposase
MGAQQCLQWASALPAAEGITRWGIEGAMHYGRALAQHLVRHGVVVVEVPGSATAGERRRSRGREAEKSDGTDALAIARVALRDGERLPGIGVDGAAARCHALSEHRDNLVLARTAALNQLYAHVTHTHPDARRYAFQARRNRPWLRTLSAAKPSGSTPITQARAMIVGQLATMVLTYDELIRALDQELRVLAEQLAPELLTIHGVGPLSAAKLVGIVHHIASGFRRRPASPRMPAWPRLRPPAATDGGTA